MKCILVTGGTGFVGENLLNSFGDSKCVVKALTRRQKWQNPEGCIISILHNDISQGVPDVEALSDVNCVIHLAGRAHVLRDASEDPEIDFHRINVEGTVVLAKQAIAAGVQHFIFISSIGAVASCSDVPLTEEHDCQPDTPYGRSKLAAEKALIDLASSSSMAWTILRPALVYGAGNPGNMGRLFRLVETNLPLPFGQIQNQRSFVYVENLVDAIAICIDNPKAFNQVFHVSDGHHLSTPQLVRLIAVSAERRCLLLPIPVRLLKGIGQLGDGMERLWPHQLPINSQTIEKLTSSLVVKNDKICNILDWTPPFTVEHGLRKTFQQ